MVVVVPETIVKLNFITIRNGLYDYKKHVNLFTKF